MKTFRILRLLARSFVWQTARNLLCCPEYPDATAREEQPIETKLENEPYSNPCSATV